MVSIFVGQFVNTALLLTLNSANFKDIDGGSGPLSFVFMVGDLTDFNVDWYRSVGGIIMKTMFMTALWPLIEFGMFYSLMFASRCFDRGCGWNTFSTQCKSVQSYIDLYAGPEYLIHYRYATILLNIGVAFLYGTAMPYLYVCALLAFTILYLNERLLVCFYYREPPAFDEKMTLMTLELTKKVPLMMLPVVFWQLGNRQIFDTKVFEIVYKTDVQMSGHSIGQSLDNANPMFLTYNSGPILVFFMIFIYVVWKALCGGEEEEEEDDQLVEGLSEYYEALKKDDKNIIVGQEEFYKYHFKLQSYADVQYNKIKSAGEADKEHIIMGCATYRLLDSLTYVQGFQYEPPKKTEDGSVKRDGVIFISTDERDDEEIEAAGETRQNDQAQHDATYIAVFFAYLPTDKQNAINFDTSGGATLC